MDGLSSTARHGYIGHSLPGPNQNYTSDNYTRNPAMFFCFFGHGTTIERQKRKEKTTKFDI
jgi:hypothetical protein